MTTATNSIKINHAYKDPETGEKWPSVSSVKGVMDKPALGGWRIKQASLRAVDAYESGELGKRMRAEGKEKTRKWIFNASRDNMNSAALRGSDLHEILDRHSKGEPVPSDLTPDAKGMVEQYFKFIDREQPEFLYSEVSMINQDYRYCGTADAIMRLPNRQLLTLPIMTDYKSTQSGAFGEWAMQLAAYANMSHYVTELDFGEQILHEMPEVDQEGGLVIRINPDAYYLHWVKPGVMAEAWKAFKGLRAAYDWFNLCQEYGAPNIYRTESMEESKLSIAQQLEAADTDIQLNEIWRQASAAGTWDAATHLPIAKRKREEINA